MASIQQQDLPPMETIVVDGLSTDRTQELAAPFARVISQDCGIATARLLGAEAARGELVMNLDSDQWLERTALQRAAADGHAVVAFGESSVGGGVVAVLNEFDRRRLHRHWQQQLDPVYGTIRPRLYPREMMIRAIREIPEDLLRTKPGPYSEDSIIYSNSGVPPTSVGFVPDAVVHQEMESVIAYLRKWKKYGECARPYRGTDLEKYAHRRAARPGSWADAIAGFPALALRAFPFVVGYYL